MSREYFQKRLQSASGEFDAQACLQVLDAAKLAPADPAHLRQLSSGRPRTPRSKPRSGSRSASALKCGPMAELCGRKVEEYRKEEAQLRRQIKEAIERSQKEGGKA